MEKVYKIFRVNYVTHQPFNEPKFSLAPEFMNKEFKSEEKAEDYLHTVAENLQKNTRSTVQRAGYVILPVFQIYSK